jgi:predicted DNA-binding protein
MAATDTTTIRVPIETRDRLNSLAARRGEPAGDVVAKLVSAADEDAMLAEVAASFEKIAADPEALSAYRAESEGLESGFEASAPEW